MNNNIIMSGTTSNLYVVIECQLIIFSRYTLLNWSGQLITDGHSNRTEQFLAHDFIASCFVVHFTSLRHS